MIRIRTPRKLAYIGYGKPKKEGDPVPYPNGVFVTTTAGTFYIASPEEAARALSERLDSTHETRQLSLFEVST